MRETSSADLEARLNRITERLKRLSETEQRGGVRNESMSCFMPNPPLTEDALLAFEGKHGVELPREYRAFLRIVGNGGVGPYEGVRTLERSVVDVVLARLFQPEKWDQDMWNKWREETLPADVDPLDGTLMIADAGCGYACLLVVTGNERGTVWKDYSVADGGLVSTGKRFLDWFEQP